MNKSLIAVVFLSVVLISSASFARAPKAADIPSIQVQTPNGVSNVFDLDRYVLDYDNLKWITNNNMAWVANRLGSAPTAVLSASNVFSVNAGAAGGAVGSYSFVVTDASGSTANPVSQFHAASALGLYPALAQDALLTPNSAQPNYSYILDDPGAAGASATSLGATVVASATGTNWQSTYIKAVYDASLNAAYAPRVTLAVGSPTATISGLTAKINATGAFTLTSTGALSNPVLVAFKGINLGNASNWTGVSAFVSQALQVAARAGVDETAPTLAINDNFETAATGRIAEIGYTQAPYSYGSNRRPGVADNSWVSNVRQAYVIGGLAAANRPSVTVEADASLPADLQAANSAGFVGDHSGQALKIALLGGSATNPFGAYVTINSSAPITAGYCYAVELSVGTDAATDAAVPELNLVGHTFGFTEQANAHLGPSAPPNAAVASGPKAGQGWVRMRVYLEPSSTAAADGSPAGLAATFLVLTKTSTPVNVYVDNFRIYKAAMPDDLAAGNAKVAVAGRPNVSVGSRVREYIDSTASAFLANRQLYGNFEASTGTVPTPGSQTGAWANGWLAQTPTGAAGGTVAVTVGSSDVATRIEAADANWLEVAFSGVAGKVQTVRTPPLVQSVGGTYAAGQYVMSLDYQTPPGTNKPSAVLGITDNGFQSYGYLEMRNGTNGAIRRIRVPVALRDLDKIQYLYTIKSNTANAETLHIDNVQLDKVADLTEYYDASLFQ